MSKSAILAAVLTALLFLPIRGAGEYLVVFRGKSKHTSLVAPINGWEIPGNELKSCFGDKFDEFYSLQSGHLPIGSGGTFRRLSKKDFPTTENDRGGDIDRVLERSLTFAGGKCVLLHGIFEIWSEGYGVEEVVSKGEISPQYLSLLGRLQNGQHDCDTFGPLRVHVAASVLEQPWLTTLQLEDNILSKFEHMWEFSDRMHRKGTSDQGISSEKSESPQFSQVAADSISNLPPIEELHMRVYLDEKSGYCILCRMLSRGLAAPSNSAMEPEIGFLMANLARVGPHSRILDPYCGCCSLLLAAAYLQRLQPPRSSVLKHSLGGEDKEGKGEGEGEGKGEEDGKRTKVGCRQSSGPCLVGVDSCMGADLGPIYSNFAALGLSCVLPSLTLKWDVAECLLQHRTGSGPRTIHDLQRSENFPYGDFKFDCIITDPPYGMAEAVQSRTSSASMSRGLDDGGGDEGSDTASSSSSSTDAVRGAVSTLLQLASDRLSKGGRLVFFAPHREKASPRDRGESNRLEAEVRSESLSYGREGAEGNSKSVDGMDSKMAKRKSFKKKKQVTQELKVEAEGKLVLVSESEKSVNVMNNQETGSLEGEIYPIPHVTGPLDFLPPIPIGLVLVEFHQQVMSPTFSRWLCVLQKE